MLGGSISKVLIAALLLSFATPWLLRLKKKQTDPQEKNHA